MDLENHISVAYTIGYIGFIDLDLVLLFVTIATILT
jgi:hypothetical protein